MTITHNEIIEALFSLVPDAKWNLVGDDYSSIDWIYGDKPTLEQLQNEIELLPIKKAKLSEEMGKAKNALLARLGITEEEAKLLLS
jgi:hypothetical protein